MTTPVYKLMPHTLILDQENDVRIHVEGSLPLPIGAVVHLVNPNRNARVIGVHLQLGPGDDALLVLQVDVTAVNPK